MPYKIPGDGPRCSATNRVCICAILLTRLTLVSRSRGSQTIENDKAFLKFISPLFPAHVPSFITLHLFINSAPWFFLFSLCLFHYSRICSRFIRICQSTDENIDLVPESRFSPVVFHPFLSSFLSLFSFFHLSPVLFYYSRTHSRCFYRERGFIRIYKLTSENTELVLQPCSRWP